MKRIKPRKGKHEKPVGWSWPKESTVPSPFITYERRGERRFANKYKVDSWDGKDGSAFEAWYKRLRESAPPKEVLWHMKMQIKEDPGFVLQEKVDEGTNKGLEEEDLLNYVGAQMLSHYGSKTEPNELKADFDEVKQQKDETVENYHRRQVEAHAKYHTVLRSRGLYNEQTRISLASLLP